ncbi:helix-turn-helix DNA binding domain protein [Arthrobacter phage Aoka]|nr:helix-turn-helix DNA binding domain protein [Arthrobacter phage Aoka]
MSEKTTGQVADRVRREARRQKVRQAELAEAAGLTQQAISRRFTGEVEISVSEAEIFARLLNVSVAWLFGETADPAPVPALQDA